MKTLIFGAGWLGHKFAEALEAELVTTDISDKHAVAKILDQKKPDRVLNAAGKTGRPNIDWCEDHKLETLESNTTGPFILAKACLERNIYMVHLASGCIFSGASPKPGGFSESDQAQPVSFYAWTKLWADEVLKNFPVLIIRLRMPIDSAPGPRNLITKLSKYSKIIDVINSVSVVDDLVSATEQLMRKRRTGIYNVTNPGPVKHRDIMEWYQSIVDPNHQYHMIESEELRLLGLAKTGRSNCILNTDKLAGEGIVMRPAREAIIDCLHKYKQNLNQA